MSEWLRSRVASLERISGYEKPERYPKVIRMDTNENLMLPRRFVSRIIHQASSDTDVREYPSTQYEELRAGLGRYLNIPKDSIAIGSGSDQIIDLLLSTFADDSSTITVTPTFTFYKDRCNLRSIKMKELPLDHDFSFDAKKLLSMADRTGICYLCSPNNPTGNQFDKTVMQEVIRRFDGLVIIDEAYVEFADYTLKDLVRKCDNLVVLRTMSKAFGLAGARVGYMVSNKSIAQLFVNTIQYPYPLSSLSLKAASLALSRINYVRAVIEKVKKERTFIIKAIEAVGLRAFTSQANFVLFEVGKQYEKLFRMLVKRGVLVRNIGNIGRHRGCLRVTVGTRSMNDRFLKALKGSVSD